MKKALKYLLLLITLLVITATSLTYIYKDDIIQHFIDEVNGQINTPIAVQKIDISLLDQLPYISVVLHEVNIQESTKHSEESLLQASKILCALNPLDILSGDYSIQVIDVKDATIAIKVDQHNTPNYLILKKNSGDSTSGSVLHIGKVNLQNSKIIYQNDYNHQHISLEAEDLVSSLQAYGKVYEIKAKGDLTVNRVTIGQQQYLENKALTVDTDFIYNQYQRSLDIQPSTATYKSSTFEVSGQYAFKESNLSLHTSTSRTNFTTLKELIPARYLSKLDPYQYHGDLSFALELHGRIKKGTLPPTKITFEVKDADILYPEKKIKVENSSLSGYYTNHPDDSLHLTSLTGDFNGQPFTSSISIVDFQDPFIQLAYDGALPAEILNTWSDMPEIDSTSGNILLDFSLTGRINDLKNRKTIPNITASGDIAISNFNVFLANRDYHLSEMKGNLLFDNNDLAISGFSGFIGESDFEVTGLIKNFLAFSVLDHQSIGIEADFTARHINLDQLLAGHTFDQKVDHTYHFSISPLLYMKLNCDIDHLQFRRFETKSLQGDLTVRRQVLSSKEIKLKTMGGDISLSGNINAQSDSIYVSSVADLSHIHIDSLFYVFENFNQRFLVDSHLKGVVNAHIDNQVNFDQSLDVNPSSIRADIHTTIIDGQLNNFEPMQKLSKYIDADKLDKLRFAELANDIHVENQTIYLPSMQVNSNVTNITIGGTHTFDQHINYSVVAPFNNNKRQDKDEAFGAIETTQSGQTKVFLKITGTTSDYKISFDKSAVKKEIISDLKREVRQLKEAFRKKGKKEKEEVELEEEDYFDW